MEKERVSEGDKEPTWFRRMMKAQKDHRPTLKDWDHDGFGHQSRRERDFKKFVREVTKDPVKRGLNDITLPDRDASAEKLMSTSLIDRISCQDMDVPTFFECYESKNIPLVITGIPEAEKWTSWTNGEWTLDSLRESYGKRLFKCGEDDDGYAIKIKFKYFIEYMKTSSADSPLYVFDSRFPDDDVSCHILSQFNVPSYFRDDLFHLAGEKRRPPYRWFLCGPARSGTCVHVDPLGTSAWNTTLSGRKYWVIFPPGLKKAFAKCTSYIRKGEEDEAINYFIDLLPRLRAASIAAGKPVPFMEFVQEKGDTVFIPGGWWHAVLNLDDTVAITQNFCSRNNFDEVWRQTRTGRKKMAYRWWECMQNGGVELVHPKLKEKSLKTKLAEAVLERLKEEEKREKQCRMKPTDEEEVMELKSISPRPGEDLTGMYRMLAQRALYLNSQDGFVWKSKAKYEKKDKMRHMMSQPQGNILGPAPNLGLDLHSSSSSWSIDSSIATSREGESVESGSCGDRSGSGSGSGFSSDSGSTSSSKRAFIENCQQESKRAKSGKVDKKKCIESYKDQME